MDPFIVPSIQPLQHFAVRRSSAMFGPFFSTVFLAFESGNVIGLRMMKIMSGGSGSHDEAKLMVTEKMRLCWRPVQAFLLEPRQAVSLIGFENTSPPTRSDCHVKL
jgi:hypothetical protein